MKVDKTKTLYYAIISNSGNDNKFNFLMGKKDYQFIQTAYDNREDGRGTNTLAICYDYKAQKYVVLTGKVLTEKEITIY